MPNGALTSLAGNVDPHHRVAAADLLLVQNRVRETVERLWPLTLMILPATAPSPCFRNFRECAASCVSVTVSPVGSSTRRKRADKVFINLQRLGRYVEFDFETLLVLRTEDQIVVDGFE
jgi:hypothetical protein